MHRRDFLKLLGMVLFGSAATACGGSNSTGEPVSGNRRILVIGAGLAGLAAALELKRYGHEVVVVDARDRIGGRIWTSTKWPDVPLDLGASWIHGVRGNPLTELADDIQATRLTTSYARAITYSTSGQVLSESEIDGLAQLREQLLRAVRTAQKRDPDVSVRQATEQLTQQYPASSEAARMINFVLSGEIEHEYSGSAAQLSAHWYDSDKAFEGNDVLFEQGFRVITDYLARDIQVVLGQVVKQIDWDQSQVRVLTQKAEYTADCVVVTLPLGVLQGKSVRFTPELPAEKRNAIEKLGMGVLNKCYLRFSDAFWPDDVDWLEYISAEHGQWTEWVSLKRVANMPILLGFNAADYGREIEALSDQQIVASAMRTLKIVFGARIPEPVDYQITRWATDPFALGSYSYNALGSTPAMRSVLAKPLSNRLFFAGEASHKDYFGTAHGAYLSGLRAAKEIEAT